MIVGDGTTFGKGTVQNILPLKAIMDRMGLAHDGNPGALKVTISKFYRPSGGSTELRGVASDIVIPSSSEAADVGEAKLIDPLPWDTVPAAPYDRVERVAAALPLLRAGSARRIAADPGLRGAAPQDRLRQGAGRRGGGLAERVRAAARAGRRRGARPGDRRGRPARGGGVQELRDHPGDGGAAGSSGSDPVAGAGAVRAPTGARSPTGSPATIWSRPRRWRSCETWPTSPAPARNPSSVLVSPSRRYRGRGRERVRFRSLLPVCGEKASAEALG